MKNRSDLPIILSRNTHTGIMVFPSRKMGGRDMMIVCLDKDKNIQSGETFNLEDIEWVKAVLHFSDVSSLQITIDTLTSELKRWEKEQNG